MSEEIKSLHEKIDFLTQQVTSVTNRLKAVDDFKEDVAMFASDAFGEVVDFLADMDRQFQGKDMLDLLKKLMLNMPNISAMMDQLKSFSELMEDVTPLAKEMFNDMVIRFEKLEQDGIFRNIETMLSGVKRLNDNFSAEDLERMGDNHVRLLKLSNKLATSQNLDKLEQIVHQIETIDFNADRKVSLFKILKKARSKDVLRSLDLLLDIAGTISRQDKATNT